MNAYFELHFALYYILGTKPRSIPARRSVSSDSASHKGGDCGPRSPRHTQAASWYCGSTARACCKLWFYFNMEYIIVEICF